MGAIQGIKNGTRGCSFNNRFTLQYIQAVNSCGNPDLGCVNGTNSTDGKIRKSKTIRLNVNNTLNNSTGPVGDICNGFFYNCCYGSNSYSYTSSWYENIAFITTPEGNFVVGSEWNGQSTITYNNPVTCCGADCQTDCESGGYFNTEIANWTRKLNPDGTFTEKSEGNLNQIVTSITSEDCDSGSNNTNDSGAYGTCCCPEDPSCTLGIKESACTCPSAQLNPCGSYNDSSSNNGTAEEVNADFLLGPLRGSTSVKISYLLGLNSWEYYDELYNPSYIPNLQESNGSYLDSQRIKFRFAKDPRSDNTDLDKYKITTEEKYYLQIPIEGSDPIRILIGSTSSSFAGNQLYGQTFDFTNQDYQQESLINQPILGCINISSVSRL
jgi:hypothetical protein